MSRFLGIPLNITLLAIALIGLSLLAFVLLFITDEQIAKACRDEDE